jgi:hypothetical protein
VREHGNALHIFTHAHPHWWGILTEGSYKASQYRSLCIFADYAGKFQMRLREAEVVQLDPLPGIESNGFWVIGLVVELMVAEKSSPDARSTMNSRARRPTGAPRGCVARRFREGPVAWRTFGYSRRTYRAKWRSIREAWH